MRQIERVDPALRGLLDPDDAIIPITRESLPEIRERSAERWENGPQWGQTQPRKEVIQGPDGSIDLYVFEPASSGDTGDTPRPCLLWLHGGGYIMGKGRDMWNGPFYAEEAGCVVVSVDYRLAPEHPHPAAINDSFAALQWVHAHAAALNIDPDRVAIGGASAGGGLAAGLCLHNRDNGNLPVCFQLLLYPMLDNLHETPSGQIVDHPIWCRADSFAAWEMYLNGRPLAEAPAAAAPARARDLSGLPPAFIPVGDVDLFVDENRRYAERLRAAGVAAEFASYPGMIHGGEKLGGPDTAIGKRMLQDFAEALRRAFQ